MRKEKKTAPWPFLKKYDCEHLRRIALPLGGIGTGTVSLGGRGDLRDWEIMNRPAKGFVPAYHRYGPSFLLYARKGRAKPVTRLLEGEYPEEMYDGSVGAKGLNHGLPRFEHCSFAAAYPLGQVFLADREVPLRVTIQAFNPFIPGNVADSSLPAAVIRFRLHNPGREQVTASVCGSLPAFMVADDSGKNPPPYLNRNIFRASGSIRGIFMSPRGGDRRAERWGTVALATTASKNVSSRIAWQDKGWGSAMLDFWEDFSADGRLDPRRPNRGEVNPVASLAAGVSIAPGGTASITFLVTWHFPNRYSWTPSVKEKNGCYCSDRREDWIGNHYATVFRDAWDAAVRTAARLPELEAKTVEFARSFCAQDLPVAVKEAALCNLTALRSQTTFRTADGRFFGWEGCCDSQGCCHGSCTHVWNYDQATPFLFGEIAKNMRETEFLLATDRRGKMSFRVNLPVSRAREFGKAAADGQMGCIMKVYREWQLSGDDLFLRKLWPKVRKALAFCWIKGGWDADADGVMEGCQHNTMDVEYFGPNPQMQGWYLGALRAASEMAFHLRDFGFAEKCRRLFMRGSKWMDGRLFNGEYYEHQSGPRRGKIPWRRACWSGWGQRISAARITSLAGAAWSTSSSASSWRTCAGWDTCTAPGMSAGRLQA
ncbi:MAG: GH116 family glycosyl-hydrolase [Kiritimatiellia bacterium]